MIGTASCFLSRRILCGTMRVNSGLVLMIAYWTRFAEQEQRLLKPKNSAFRALGSKLSGFADMHLKLRRIGRRIPLALQAHAHRVAEMTLALLEKEGIRDEPMEEPPPDLKLRFLPESTAKLLLKNSISPFTVA